MSAPLGGDWGSGERVFGPPRGTVEADWFVPLVREQHPGIGHDGARDAVRAAWAAVHGEAERAGVAPAEVDLAAVRHLLGLTGSPAEAAAATAADHPADGDTSGVLSSALRVVLAATKAYDDPPGPARARGDRATHGARTTPT